MIYLDNNASSPVADECADVISTVLKIPCGNASSKHQGGHRARAIIEDARRNVAELFKAKPAEIVFTSGGSESNHFAILSALAANPNKNHVITSNVEHPSTLKLLKHLETHGIEVTYLSVDTHGALRVEQVEDALKPKTALVSLMWANNETGVLFPIEAIAKLTKESGILFHTDAVQALGKITIDLEMTPIDMMSISGHKIHAPAGVGALYLRKGIPMTPLLFGHQERGRRGGTENITGIAALGVASALLNANRPRYMETMHALRLRLEHGILSRIPFARINGGNSARVVNTVNIQFGELEAEMIVDRLDKAGICVALGAACSAGSTTPSHVLTAMGLSEQQARASVRFSTSRFNTIDEIDKTIEKIIEIVLPMAQAA